MVTRPISFVWDNPFPLSSNAISLDPISAREMQTPEGSPRNSPLLEQQLRQQLARELHDGPVQTLSNVTLQLMALQKQIMADPGGAQKELSSVVAFMQRAVKEMRGIMFELRPLALEREGLVAALREFVSYVSERHPLEIVLEAPPTALLLSPVLKTNIFYIVQEAVQNSVKHAQAKHVRIALTLVGEELQVFVSDDGKGFDLHQVHDGYSTRKSLGLLNLSERAQLIQGELTLYSNIGQGTTVHLSVPLADSLR